jgi:hypothetical protein
MQRWRPMLTPWRAAALALLLLAGLVALAYVGLRLANVALNLPISQFSLFLPKMESNLRL